jgi:hypothetical protein
VTATNPTTITTGIATMINADDLRAIKQAHSYSSR